MLDTDINSSDTYKIFIVPNNEYNIKSKLDEIEDDDELEFFFEKKLKTYNNEDIIKIYQGNQLLIGLLLKNEYKLYDFIFDLSNSEKQSVLSNFTWEGQYQVMVCKQNNCIKLYEEGNDLNNLINLDDGSYINLINIYEIGKLNSNFYLFQCSIIIKPQYWNDKLNLDILFKYSIYYDNNNFSDIYLDENIDDHLLFETKTNNYLISNEKQFYNNILSFSISKPIIIKVPLTISNFFLQENSYILYIEILNISESSESIIIEHIFGHHLKINNSLNLPFTLENNQSLGCSLIISNEKKISKNNHNINNQNYNLSNIIPIFIKWKFHRNFNSKYILTQFAIQIHDEEKFIVLNKIDNQNISDENIITPINSPIKYHFNESNHFDFSATCTFDNIAQYPGQTIYLFIEIFPNNNDKHLNLEVIIEYNHSSPIIPLYEKMNIYYNPDYDDHPILLYPIKICYPGIFNCPNIYIIDLICKSKYIINKPPLLVCKNITDIK